MRSSRYFAVFSFTLFFSLFSIVSLFLQNTSINLLSVITDSHFLSRIVIGACGLALFLFFPKKSLLNDSRFFFILLLLSYIIALVSIFFSRDGNPHIYKEVIQPGLLLTASNILFISETLDRDNITIEDVFLVSLLLSSSAVMLFLLTDFAFFFILLISIILLSFSVKFSFGIKVFLLSLLLISISLLSFFMNAHFVSTFFEGLSLNKPFMTFLRKTESSLSSSLSPFVFVEYATGEMIFSLLYRFKVYGMLVFAVLLSALVVLLYSISGKTAKMGKEKEARLSYAIATVFALQLLFSLLSIASESPLFKCDLPFITPSNLSIFVEIVLLSYVATPIKDEENLKENLSNTDVVETNI